MESHQKDGNKSIIWVLDPAKMHRDSIYSKRENETFRKSENKIKDFEFGKRGNLRQLYRILWANVCNLKTCYEVMPQFYALLIIVAQILRYASIDSHLILLSKNLIFLSTILKVEKK